MTADKLKKILDAAGGWAGDRRTMQTVLLALRNQLRSKTMPKQQPPDGTCGRKGCHLDGLDKPVTAIAKGPPLSVAATLYARAFRALPGTIVPTA